MRHIAMVVTAAVLAAGLWACSSQPSSGGAAPMADCCKKSADLKAQMPKCCASGDGECCKASKADPSKASECCKKADQLSAQMPDCCKKAAAGQPQACCTAK
jgi:hypothetical protein